MNRQQTDWLRSCCDLFSSFPSKRLDIEPKTGNGGFGWDEFESAMTGASAVYLAAEPLFGILGGDLLTKTEVERGIISLSS